MNVSLSLREISAFRSDPLWHRFTWIVFYLYGKNDTLKWYTSYWITFTIQVDSFDTGYNDRSKRGSARPCISVMAEITHKVAANNLMQCFFVIVITSSTHCLVENFQLICYSLWLNATWWYIDSASSSYRK